jgi:hypothetical protein
MLSDLYALWMTANIRIYIVVLLTESLENWIRNIRGKPMSEPEKNNQTNCVKPT